MNNIFTAAFDPVSAAEIRNIRAIAKNTGLKDVFLSVKEEGILSRSQRISLLKQAVRPYRHIHVLEDAVQGIAIEETDEEKIREGHFRLAPRQIRTSLIQCNAYLDQIIDAMCKPSRAVHSRGVAETARHLAQVHGLDTEKAYRMGMLHDITKRMDDEEGRKIIALYKPEWLTLSPKVWHSYTAVIWLKQNMHLYDHELLSAIEHHTLGDGCTLMDHILYISDKNEPGRGYDTSRQMKLAEEDLAAAARMIREESRAYIFEKEGIHV